MIPKHERARARKTTLISIGIVLAGAILAGTWVLIYMPK
jgi:hypothetical protein